MAEFWHPTGLDTVPFSEQDRQRQATAYPSDPFKGLQHDGYGRYLSVMMAEASGV